MLKVERNLAAFERSACAAVGKAVTLEAFPFGFQKTSPVKLP